MNDTSTHCFILYTGAYDPNIYTFDDVMRAAFVSSDVLMMNEMNQVHGYVTILDFSEFGMQHMDIFNTSLYSKISKCMLVTDL